MSTVKAARRLLCIPVLLLSGLFLTLGYITGKWAVWIAEGKEAAEEWTSNA